MTDQAEKLTYSNPLMELVIPDYPYGRTRTKATYSIEGDNGKQRAVRVTVNPRNGINNKPKKTTYSNKARIVSGSDGRTYIAELAMYGGVSIRQWDMKHQQEVIYDGDERY